jgi:hypothetical protein
MAIGNGVWRKKREFIDNFLKFFCLQEYGGNLNEAVNAHFIEGNRHMYGNGVHAKNFFYPFISSYLLLMPLSEVGILLAIRG